MGAPVTRVYFDETVFLVPPLSPVRFENDPSKNLSKIWIGALTHQSAVGEPYVLIITPEAKVRAKNVEGEDPLTMVLSRKGEGKESIVTVSLQTEAGEIKDTHEFPIRILIERTAAITDGVQAKIERERRAYRLTDDFAKKTRDAGNDKANELRQRFFGAQGQFGKLIEAPRHFFDQLGHYYSIADIANIAQAMHGDVRVELDGPGIKKN